MPTAEELLKEAERLLRASPAVDHPHPGKERADAEELLAFAVGDELGSEEEVPLKKARRFRQLVDRRAAGEPPAYVTNRTEFFGLEMEVRPGAFIPRQSSEWMADLAIRRLRGRRAGLLVDLATGIGPVALAVASALPKARVFGVDLSESPIALARKNARRLGIRNARFLRGDLFDPLPPSVRGDIDVITIHPPYVGRREIKELPEEIRGFEPEEALTDYSPAGMSLLGHVAAEAPRWLKPGGWLLVEVSPDRSRAVATVLRGAGFGQVRSTKGPVPVSRVIVGRR